jgi:hypothetical protein
VFFGLKAGLTFATSIPAAVISMALLRGFRDSTVQENNIVQTVASAAGTLSSIIFVLPGLVIDRLVDRISVLVVVCDLCARGILGVMYSIPLRRALVTNSDLPYPEGVACAEVLKVGGGGNRTKEADDENRAGLLAVVWGSISAAVFALIVATRTFAADVVQYFRFGSDDKGPGQRLRLQPVDGVVRSRTPRRPLGRRRDGRWRADRLGLGRAALLRHRRRRRRGRGCGAVDMEPQGALRRCRHDRCRRDLDAGKTRQAGRQRSGIRRGSLTHTQGRAGGNACRAPSRTFRSALSA